MKPLKLILFFALLSTYSLFAQVGIGTTSPNASLEIQSTDVTSPSNTDGLLIPKVDEFPTTNPAAAQDGMLVFATGNGSVSKGFYYWNNSTTLWEQLAGNNVDRVNDLFDGKADPIGSSIFIGTDAGLNDDNTNNFNTAMGYGAMMETTTGAGNSAMGYQALRDNITGIANTAIGTWALRDSETGRFNTAIGLHSMLYNTTGTTNTAIGAHSLRDNATGYSNVGLGNYALANNISGFQNTAVGYYSGGFTNGDQNVFLGHEAGANGSDTKSGSVFIGYRAGYSENNDNKLYIENSSSANPLIYGEFDTDFLQINGDLEAYKPSDSALKVLSNSGNQSSVKMFEAGDYGFELEYDGSPDKLYLWSRRFAGNEGIRMTWLKDGRVGIGTTSPYAKLDLEASNAASPSITDGLLVPRIDAFPSTNPGANQNGMLIFLNTDNSFYYWNDATTSWVNIVSNATAVEAINDLSDGNSDNDGSNNGSSIYLGVSSGDNDDLTDNRNVAIGYTAMQANISGARNVAMGYQSLAANTSGLYNSAFGYRSLAANTTGFQNTSLGYQSMNANSSGYYNVAVGTSSLGANTTGYSNTAVGWGSLGANTTASFNTAIGLESLYSNTLGSRNAAVGTFALNDNTLGSLNTAMGNAALSSNTSANANTAMGASALLNNTIGDYNTAVGYTALRNNTNGDYNTALGYNASASTTTYFNTTALGYNAQPNSSNQVRIGNASIAVIGGYASWSVFSDERVKTNIREDIAGLEFIKRLRPVSYNYDMDAIARFERTPDSLRLRNAEGLKAAEVQTGFIAQEVEAAAAEVGFNFHGVVKPESSDQAYALRYSEFVVPMVKAIQEQQAIIEEQTEEINALRREIEEIKLLLGKD